MPSLVKQATKLIEFQKNLCRLKNLVFLFKLDSHIFIFFFVVIVIAVDVDVVFGFFRWAANFLEVTAVGVRAEKVFC